MQTTTTLPECARVGRLNDCSSAAMALILMVLLLISFFTGVAAGNTPPKNDYGIKPLLLPGVSGTVTLDYFAYDHSRDRLWVPGANTGAVHVIDAATDQISRVGKYPTAEFEIRGKKGVLGPSSISFGDGVVYIGNRADSTICVIDATTLEPGDCVRVASPADGLAAAPDGLAYVPTTKELWVTTGAPPMGIAAPGGSLTIFSASTPGKLQFAMKLPLGGSAEGYAVDDQRGLFYTNLEESGRTVAVDVRRRAIVGNWASGCQEPHGMALDKRRRFLFVACPDRVVALDAGHDGRMLSTIDTGDGLDNIDYSDESRTVYAAASVTATMTMAKVDDQGKLTAMAVIPTAKGARVVVAGADGRAYVADPRGGRILKIYPK